MDFQVKFKGLEFNLDISNSVPEKVTLDQKRYKQVLYNLIGNAIKFTLNGSIQINVKMN